MRAVPQPSPYSVSHLPWIYGEEWLMTFGLSVELFDALAYYRC